MPTISTPGFPNLYPLLVVGHAEQRESRNIIHSTIDPAGTNDYVSLATASRRTGTLALFFDDQDKAQECLDRHALRLVFTAHDDGVHISDMTYVVSGRIRIEQSESRQTWLVTVDFQEIQP